MLLSYFIIRLYEITPLVIPNPFLSACNCDIGGSLSPKCDDLGYCQCKENFEGMRCDRYCVYAVLLWLKYTLREF